MPIRGTTVFARVTISLADISNEVSNYELASQTSNDVGTGYVARSKLVADLDVLLSIKAVEQRQWEVGVRNHHSQPDHRFLQRECGRSLLVGDGDNWRAFEARLEQGIEIEHCRDLSSASCLLRAVKFRSVVFDWGLSSKHSQGSELCRLARGMSPDIPLVAATAVAAVRERVQALEAGVDDCITYEIETTELLARIQAIARRRASYPRAAEIDDLQGRAAAVAPVFRLSSREQEVLVLLAGGTHPKEIAASVGCSYSTIRTHVQRLCRKLGCSGPREAIVKFFLFDPSLQTRSSQSLETV